MNAYFSQYQTNQVSTATPEQLLIMLYDGAIRFANQAKDAIDQKDPEDRNYYVNKTLAIIYEFSATLNHEVGGQIAADLASLYDFMVRQLNRANIKNDAASLDTVIGLLTDLRETWRQAIELNNRTRPAAAQKDAAPGKDYKPLNASL